MDCDERRACHATNRKRRFDILRSRKQGMNIDSGVADFQQRIVMDQDGSPISTKTIAELPSNRALFTDITNTACMLRREYPTLTTHKDICTASRKARMVILASKRKRRREQNNPDAPFREPLLIAGNITAGNVTNRLNLA
ncbi:hypothetical protein PIB30_068115 [Stylosanthes scabra]|uniref:Uncharacterized protein n=1 Tax=Stylosanthes scabra TaxID=79078 RepID=A0ABU6RNP5_9FABA|nr:hypothetical protein [Stylosanthes scabra]